MVNPTVNPRATPFSWTVLCHVGSSPEFTVPRLLAAVAAAGVGSLSLSPRTFALAWMGAEQPPPADKLPRELCLGR